MQRYFINEQYEGQEYVKITGDDCRHISRVMRMKAGDSLWIAFRDEKTASATISSMTDSYIEVMITSWENVKKELPLRVTVASGLPKGDKLEWIIQKGTELGAAEFVPFIAARSIVKWEEKKAAKKVERWQKIAKEAAEQSHRQVLPEIHAPFNLKELIRFGNEFDWKLVAYEEVAKEGEQGKFAGVLNKAVPGEKVLFVFGPEGGLTEKEVKELEENGFELCGLGPRIMRTETAPLYTLAAISYQFELMR